MEKDDTTKTPEDEIGAFVKRLNEIQTDYHATGTMTDDMKVAWRQTIFLLKMRGVTAKKVILRDDCGNRLGVRWEAVKKDEGHKAKYVAEWKNRSVRPDDGERCLRGDCTTRSMTYALGGVFSYREIEREQYRRAELKHSHRNISGIWDSIMLDLGYTWVCLRGKIRRDRLAILLAPVVDYPVITLSARHAAIVEAGAVVDTWDSRGGRCKALLVKDEDAQSVVDELWNRGYGSSAKEK